MTAPLVWENGVARSVKSFPSRQLFPEPLVTGGNICYFLPLHFNQRCLGYYIIKNNDFPLFNILCHTMTMSIGNAIDAVSKINVLDPLCKIYNRNGFERNAGFAYKEYEKSGEKLSICFVDLDGLKYINDTYGHKEGDFAIKSVAEVISASCGPSDICGRLGGDEFVVLGIGGSFAERFQDRFTAKLKELNDNTGKPYVVEASIGFATMSPEEHESLLDLVQKADAQMYEKKKLKKTARQ